ncbi:MAG TPA: NADH-quinone oxidoreductase subunit A [Armatimonadota bacterium]
MPAQPPPPITGFAAILAAVLVALFLAGVFVCVSVFLGPKRPTPTKSMPYESGMSPVGNTKQQFSVHYYLVAMLFIVFDIDIIFMYPWGLLLRNHLRGFGLVEMGIFVLTLVVGYIYVVKKKVIEWE